MNREKHPHYKMIDTTNMSKNEINDKPQYKNRLRIICNRSKNKCNPQYKNTKRNQSKPEPKPIINKREEE